jgi:hypothetical protein
MILQQERSINRKKQSCVGWRTYVIMRQHVRFGSLADICSAKRHVRFTPNSDRKSGHAAMVMSALPSKADMCSAASDVCYGPTADILPSMANRKTASRRSLRNPIRCFNQTARVAAFRFLRQPRRPNAPRPVAKSGSAAGNGEWLALGPTSNDG